MEKITVKEISSVYGAACACECIGGVKDYATSAVVKETLGIIVDMTKRERVQKYCNTRPNCIGPATSLLGCINACREVGRSFSTCNTGTWQDCLII